MKNTETKAARTWKTKTLTRMKKKTMTTLRTPPLLSSSPDIQEKPLWQDEYYKTHGRYPKECEEGRIPQKSGLQITPIQLKQKGQGPPSNMRPPLTGLSRFKPPRQLAPPKKPAFSTASQAKAYLQNRSGGGGGKASANPFSPISFKQYFDKLSTMKNGTTLYSAGLKHKSHVFVGMHGCGFSGASFACLAREVSQFATFVSFDFRGHGFNKMKDPYETMSSDQLVEDSIEVFEYLAKVFKGRSLIVIGHR